MKKIYYYQIMRYAQRWCLIGTIDGEKVVHKVDGAIPRGIFKLSTKTLKNLLSATRRCTKGDFVGTPLYEIFDEIKEALIEDAKRRQSLIIGKPYGTLGPFGKEYLKALRELEILDKGLYGEKQYHAITFTR